MRYLKCFSVGLRINMHKTLVWNARSLSCKCFKFKSIRLLVHSSSNWFFLKHQGPHWHIWPHTNTVTIMASNDLSLLAILDRNTPTAAISHLITSVFWLNALQHALLVDFYINDPPQVAYWFLITLSWPLFSEFMCSWAGTSLLFHAGSSSLAGPFL